MKQELHVQFAETTKTLITGNCSCSALHGREKSIEDTLSGEQRMISRKLLGDRPRLTNRPDLHQGVRGLNAVEFSLENGVLQIRDGLKLIFQNDKRYAK